jgi:hypothetical protein
VDRLQGLAEQARRDRAVAVPLRPNLEGDQAFPLVRVTGEDDDPGRGLERPQPGHPLHSAQLGQIQIEKEDRGRSRRQAAQELAVIGNLDRGKGVRTLPPGTAHARDGTGDQDEGRRLGSPLVLPIADRVRACEPGPRMRIGKRRRSSVVQHDGLPTSIAIPAPGQMSHKSTIYRHNPFARWTMSHK